MIDIILALLLVGVVLFVGYLLLIALFEFGAFVAQFIGEGAYIVCCWLWDKLNKK
jgi:inner membrane protein involved in colicin E2 resistance